MHTSSVVSECCWQSCASTTPRVNYERSLKKNARAVFPKNGTRKHSRKPKRLRFKWLNQELRTHHEWRTQDDLSERKMPRYCSAVKGVLKAQAGKVEWVSEWVVEWERLCSKSVKAQRFVPFTCVA
jgi:hypothetical protein